VTTMMYSDRSQIMPPRFTSLRILCFAIASLSRYIYALFSRTTLLVPEKQVFTCKYRYVAVSKGLKHMDKVESPELK
jgi:hypothetical protein